MRQAEHTVRTLVAELCGVDPGSIQSDSDLREYGMDSVRGVELLIRLEEAFGITMPDEALPGLRTLADIVERVSRERIAAHEDPENADRPATKSS